MLTKSTNILKKIYKTPSWIIIGIVYVFYFIECFNSLDPDFGWHLKTGEYIYNNGFPRLDVFTYTASDFPFVSHEWLNDVLVYLLMSFGGYLLLSIVFAGIWTLAVKLASTSTPPIITLMAAVSMSSFVGVRTTAWVALFVALVLYTIRNNRYLYLLPLVFLVWVQFHGSFVVGFVLIGYYAIFRRSIKLGIILALSVLATMLNPYGWHVYSEVISILGDSSLRWRIKEWMFLGPDFYSAPYIILCVVGFIFYYPSGWKRFIRLPAILLLASLASQRYYVVFVIASLFSVGDYAKNLIKYINFDKLPKKFQVAYVAIGYAVLAYLAGIYMFGLFTFITGNRDDPYPKVSVEYLRQNNCSGNIFNNYNFGGYLIWQLPQSKVYIDGRMTSWVHEGRKYMDDYLKLTDGKIDYKQEFERYDVRCAILYSQTDSTDVKLRQSLLNDGWIRVVSDGNSVLLIKP